MRGHFSSLATCQDMDGIHASALYGNLWFQNRTCSGKQFRLKAPVAGKVFSQDISPKKDFIALHRCQIENVR
jgi:hypothetical protein